ncbi:LacI family DNA-binding transcriptional regulator [Kiritimatiella glycovorans]|uniref:LacI family transcriptional regulator n=1 Tax=Kiritimatiella glycovorans TaxID=1307763 RepID=A0A0G3ELB0_9BACT|nr:LacI family DNA-binding transcriptional regulator [Kiritimatiella glycovorans]AKJ65555.1 LacI family transcriptional regulator [Kiritimatiella glycovorans]
MKKVTVYTLSEELGVSPATISKALNNSPEISPATIERIRKKADEYGFRPRPIVSRTTNICALIQTPASEMSCFSPYTVSAMEGMLKYLQEAGLEFSLYRDEVSKLNAGLLLRQLGRRGINGAVLINTDEDSAFYAEFEQQHFAYCSLLTNDGRSERLLSIDNVQAACEAVQYLIQLGHRRIGTLVTPAHGVTGRDRLKGYRKALKDSGLGVDPEVIVASEFGEDGLEFGNRETLALLDRHPDITALFVMGERVAVGALHAFYQRGLKVPEDVSLLSCDDPPEVAYLCPPLTVMRIPNRKLGYTAARWVHDMIEGTARERYPHEPWMRGELVLRQSTGPVRKTQP